MCYTTDNASLSADSSASSPTSLPSSGSASAQPPAFSVSLLSTAQKTFLKKFFLAVYTATNPCHSTPETEQDKDGATTSSAPMEVDFDASIDDLCATFERMSLNTFTPPKTEKHHGSFRKTVTAEDSRRSREETTIQIRKKNKDARMAERRHMAGLKNLARSNPTETDKDKDGATSPCLMEVDWIEFSILTPPKNGQGYGSFRQMVTAEDSRRSREETTIHIRQKKKDAHMAERRQMAGLKNLARSDPTKTDKDKDGATSPCLMEVDWIEFSILTPPKNEQFYGSFRKTVTAEDSRRSREEMAIQIRQKKKDARMAERRQMPIKARY